MAKVQDNDKKIKVLKEQILEQINNIKPVQKDFVTNLILTFRGTMYNLNVAPGRNLKELLINLYLYQFAIDKLEITEFDLCGYNVEDWICDIRKLLKIKEQNQELTQLHNTLDKLNNLMSDEAKTEEFLDAVQSMLNN